MGKFADKFASSGTVCPFGPNYGAYNSDLFPSQTICSLEGAMEFELAAGVDLQGNPWGSLWQRAFFVPIELIDEAWEWSKANRGGLDLVKPPVLRLRCRAAERRSCGLLPELRRHGLFATSGSDGVRRGLASVAICLVLPRAALCRVYLIAAFWLF